MPWKTTFQLPVRTHNGRMELFLLPDQELPVPPSTGLCLSGKNLPHVADPDSDINTVIQQVTFDFDTGVIYSTLHGMDRPSDDVESVTRELQALDPGWQYVQPEDHGAGRRQRSDPDQGGEEQGFGSWN